MKKLGVLFILVLMMFSFLYPCKIKFQSKSYEVVMGEETIIVCFVKFDHRKCDIGIENTMFELENIEITEKGEWEKIKKSYYKIEFKIILTGDEGKIRVFRECEKEGISEKEVKVVSR